MVTSAQPREGKTTTATQLAASLARSGRPHGADRRRHPQSRRPSGVRDGLGAGVVRVAAGRGGSRRRDLPDPHGQPVAAAGRSLRFAQRAGPVDFVPGHGDRRAVRAIRLRGHRRGPGAEGGRRADGRTARRRGRGVGAARREHGAQRVRGLRAAAERGHHGAGLGGQRREGRRGPPRRRNSDGRNRRGPTSAEKTG